jgi:osmoprotectant transport system permease protein
MIRALVFFLALPCSALQVTVASKTFTESFILAEIATQVLASDSVIIDRKYGLGGTGLLFEALKGKEIDLYPEYTGTISETILKKPEIKKWEDIQAELLKMGLRMTKPLGFNNSYAIAVSEKAARDFKLEKLSDLKKSGNELRWGISSEFVAREDGWPRLQSKLGLNPKQFRALSHELAYQAIGDGHVDATDAYTTDAKVDLLHLKLLEDDLNVFPPYEAVFLATTEFVEKCPVCWEKLQGLANSITAAKMRELNHNADVEKQGFAGSAQDFLLERGALSETSHLQLESIFQRLKEHILLVLVTLIFSILVGIPLGFTAYRFRTLGKFILGFSGLIQTVPSLALLCLLVPLFGIGEKPALIALCLYGLLPVVTNTCVGLLSINPVLSETALAIGLTKSQRLWRVQIPLASMSIWAGLKTSTIITIGTATLAALIGAGGFGVPIVQGLATNDIPTILTGAVPAALLAIVANILFDALELLVIPRGLRIE